ncbi:hypothetical protein [Spirillospora sp. CA-294931]|uniref:hypothetical protein n=1 Tax=Spirillospora sp. CA-294931 TaxID=3240042 RepID=UPI003D8F20E7
MTEQACRMLRLPTIRGHFDDLGETAGRDATVWPRCMDGCHSNRETVTAIRKAGFTVNRLEHLGFGETGLPFPASPQLLGSATSPAAGGAGMISLMTIANIDQQLV